MRNAWILMIAQALNGAGSVIVIALGGLAGAYLLGADKSLATLPAAAFSIGLAMGALPAGLLMQRLGRRLGFQMGNLFAVAGGVLAAVAISAGSFAGLCAALWSVGVAAAFVQQYRFAAAESVSAPLRGAAISRVMIGGIITALFAPQLVIATRDLLDPLPFAGAFVALSVVSLLGLGVVSFLRMDRATAIAAATDAVARPFAEIVRQPRFILSLLCAATAFGMMTFAMTAAPLAMVGHNHTDAQAVMGIQWHVLAMFVPSFFTGRLITRFGKEPIVIVGQMLILVSALVALAGVELLHFWGMLVLLGVGWNFGFIGATAMLTDCYRPEERGRVEGFNDLVVFSTVAVASLLSGTILAGSGWNGVNIAIIPIIGTVMLTLLLLTVQSRRNVH